MASGDLTDASGSLRATLRGTLRDEQKATTHARLVDSAVAVFGRRGYGDATVGEIARGAGASRATFYLHFASKEEVVAAIVERTRPDVEDYYTRLDLILDAGEAGGLRAWMDQARGWFEQHEAVVLALEHVLLGGPEAAAGVVPQFDRYMPRYMGRWPDGRRLEASMRVWMVVQLISRVFRSWRVDAGFPAATRDEIVDILTSAARDLLRLDR